MLIDRPAEKPDHPRVEVVILNWNGKDDTLHCLNSVDKLRYPNFHVTVVDNGSVDGSVEAVRATDPSVTVLANKENLGYSGGNNVGIRYALEQGAEYIWLLNNDAFVEPDALDALIRAAEENPSAGVLGPKVLCYPETHLLFSAGETFSLWFNRRTINVGKADDGKEFAQRDVDYVVGCAILVSNEFVKSVGMLDETFFAYFEEVDWCLRGRRSGHRILFVPRAVVYHKGEASTGKGLNPITAYYRTRNWMYFMRKHASAYHWVAFVPLFSAVFLSRLLVALVRGDVAVAGSLFRALWWQLRPHSVFGAINPAVMQRARSPGDQAEVAERIRRS